MKKSILPIAVAISLASASGVYAHHPSPADPTIGDNMGMHEAAIDAAMDQRSPEANSLFRGGETNLNPGAEIPAESDRGASAIGGPGNDGNDNAGGSSGGEGDGAASGGGDGGDGAGGGGAGGGGAGGGAGGGDGGSGGGGGGAGGAR